MTYDIFTTFFFSDFILVSCFRLSTVSSSFPYRLLVFAFVRAGISFSFLRPTWHSAVS